MPGIPEEIRNSDSFSTATIERSLPGMGDFVEVSSPILTGVAGSVHIGMDMGLIVLKIQRAIGQQVYLISIIFVVGVFAAIWFVNLVAEPIERLLAYAVGLARDDGAATDDPDARPQRRDRRTRASFSMLPVPRGAVEEPDSGTWRVSDHVAQAATSTFPTA